MPLTATELQAIATAEASKFAYVSLHTTDPSTTGANEASGGTPVAYARKASGATATAGTVNTSQVAFDAPAGTYTHWGLWSAVTGGTFFGGGPLQAGGVNTPQVLSSQGQVKVTVSIPVASA